MLNRSASSRAFCRAASVASVVGVLGAVDLVLDRDLLGGAGQQPLGEVLGAHVTGAPGGDGRDARAAPAADLPFPPPGPLDGHTVVAEGLAEELLHIARGDPPGAELRLDLGRAEVARDDPAQRGGVGLEPGVRGRGALGGGELGTDVPAQVQRCPDQPSGAGLVEHQGAQFRAGLGLGGSAEQPGDLVQPDLAVPVQADGQGLIGGVGAEHGRLGDHDPLGEDVGADRRPGHRVVAFLQRVHQRVQRVGAEPALRRAPLGLRSSARSPGRPGRTRPS